MFRGEPVIGHEDLIPAAGKEAAIRPMRLQGAGDITAAVEEQHNLAVLIFRFDPFAWYRVQCGWGDPGAGGELVASAPIEDRANSVDILGGSKLALDGVAD